MGMGDRIAVMFNGRVRQIGTPPTIYDEPADAFVATFAGSPPMNLLERDNVIVGFRPEHFLPKDVLGESSRFITYEFEVTRVEYLGADRLAYGVIHGAAGPTRIISRIPSTIPTHIEAGKTYEFEVDRSRLRYFDKESGLRTEPREEAAVVG